MSYIWPWHNVTISHLFSKICYWDLQIRSHPERRPPQVCNPQKISLIPLWSIHWNLCVQIFQSNSRRNIFSRILIGPSTHAPARWYLDQATTTISTNSSTWFLSQKLCNLIFIMSNRIYFVNYLKLTVTVWTNSFRWKRTQVSVSSTHWRNSSMYSTKYLTKSNQPANTPSISTRHM